MITVTEHNALSHSTVIREMTALEIASRNQELESSPSKSLHEIQEDAQRLKASAQIKLKALGLTDEEIAALVGG